MVNSETLYDQKCIIDSIDKKLLDDRTARLSSCPEDAIQCPSDQHADGGSQQEVCINVHCSSSFDRNFTNGRVERRKRLAQLCRSDFLGNAFIQQSNRSRGQATTKRVCSIGGNTMYSPSTQTILTEQS